MTWNVIVSKSADKYVEGLPKQERERVRLAINELVYGPYSDHLDIRKLRGRPEWRLRVGRWRVIFDVEFDKITIVVVKVDSRGDAYK